MSQKVKDALDLLNIFAEAVRENVLELEKQVQNHDGELKRSYELLLDTEINRIYVIEELIHILEAD